MLIFGKEEDWKDLLCDNSAAELAELIEKTKKHRCAYMQADDVKVAQVWCALVEVYKKLKEVECRVAKMESVAKEFIEMGEFAKKEALKTKVGDILKPKTSEEREQVDKIVESLMGF